MVRVYSPVEAEISFGFDEVNFAQSGGDFGAVFRTSALTFQHQGGSGARFRATLEGAGEHFQVLAMGQGIVIEEPDVASVGLEGMFHAAIAAAGKTLVRLEAQ